MATVSKIMKHTYTSRFCKGYMCYRVPARLPLSVNVTRTPPYSACWEPKLLQLRLQDNVPRSAEVGRDAVRKRATLSSEHKDIACMRLAHRKRQRGGSFVQQLDTRRAPQLQQAKVATAAESLQARHEKAARFTGKFECDVQKNVLVGLLSNLGSILLSCTCMVIAVM